MLQDFNRSLRHVIVYFTGTPRDVLGKYSGVYSIASSAIAASALNPQPGDIPSASLVRAALQKCNSSPGVGHAAAELDDGWDGMILRCGLLFAAALHHRIDSRGVDHTAEELDEGWGGMTLRCVRV